MGKKKRMIDSIWVVLLSVLAVLYVYPIIMILFNSMKKETAITTAGAFSLPTADAFAGIENYINAIASKGFLQSLCYSLLITITSVIAILVCCSMCAWYITRVKATGIEDVIFPVCIFYGGSVSDGHVHPVTDSGQSETQHSVEYMDHLSGIWSRTGSIYVCRLYEIHSTGDRGSIHDRWM